MVRQQKAASTPTGYGAMIRAAREPKENQNAFARRMHVSPATVSRWELEVTKPSVDQINRIVPALGLSMDDFLVRLGLTFSPLPEGKLPGKLLEHALALSPDRQRQLAETAHGLLLVQKLAEGQR